MNYLQHILKTYYDIDSINISPKQGGWSALAYKVTTTNNNQYFLKVYEKTRASTPKWTALIDRYIPIMRWLTQNTRLKDKLPVPLLTKNGGYKCEDDHGIYLLYDYIDGETIGNKKLNKDQVRQLSEIIGELHLYGKELPFDTDALQEDFNVPFIQQLREIMGNDYKCLPNDVKNFVNPYIESVNILMDRIEKLQAAIEKYDLRMALCHTDLHNWNLMQSDQQLILIDWEGLKLAPIEADHMFLVDEPYYDEFLGIYRKYHKDFSINQNAMLFYQIRRKLEDIWEFIEQLLSDNQQEQERSETLNHLKNEFEELNTFPFRNIVDGEEG